MSSRGLGATIWIWSLWLVGLGGGSGGCKRGEAPQSSLPPSRAKAAKVVRLYSHRHYPADKKLFEEFEAKTGIRVEVIQNSADELIKRMEIQGKSSDADLLMTVDAGRLVAAEKKGLLQPIRSKVLEEQIPAHLRDPKGHWFGLTQRARVIVYAKDRVKPADLSTYEALTDARWKGKILIRSSNNIYNQSLVASILAAGGKEKAEAWAKGLVANFARQPKGSDRDQIRAIGAGLGDIAIVNTYYIGLMQTSKNPKAREMMKGIGVFFPNQGDRGTHINASGAGVAKSARNKAEAIQLLEFLSSPEAQKTFAEANFEYPVHPKVEASDVVRGWGGFKADKIPLEILGEKNSEAVSICDQAGWR